MKLKSFLFGLSAAVLSAVTFASCQPEEKTTQDTLSVSPDKAITFAASGNEAVQLTVTTTAEDWTFKVPAWIDATREGDVLTVNAKDNETEEENLGRITFEAGNAEPVNIAVTQASANGGSDVPGDKISAKVLDASGVNDVNVEFAKETSTNVEIKLSLAKASTEIIEIRLAVDEKYIAQYDYSHGTTSTLLPAEAYTLSVGGTKLTVNAGETEVSLPFMIDGESLPYNTQYLLPLKAEVVSGNATFAKTADARLNYAVVRKSPRSSKQLCVMEFNDTNPLNVLTYKLEDGSYFFDGLVLFSGNICWSDDDQRVMFNKRRGEPVANANVAALIAEADVYLKPIHDAGIKIYMGLMPHHTQAGLTNISNYGCKEFAIEMAELAQDCYLDGYFLDEEYTGYDYGNMTDLWRRTSAESSENGNGGAYMSYQLWKQGKEITGRSMDVGIFQYGGLSVGKVVDHEDGTEHHASEFAHCNMANYGGSGYPMDDQTVADCCGVSIECARGYGSSAESIKAKMDQGYGWGAAWFAWDPTNSRSAKSTIAGVCELAYESKLVEPTVYYKKIGEGQYDPNPYNY